MIEEEHLKINRVITQEEYEQIMKICEEEVAKNRILQNEKYFLEVNYDLSFYKSNQWLTEFKILAKGEYFQDRLLIYYCKYEFEKEGHINLDDHSIGDTNRMCLHALRNYLISIGAESYD